jgi:Holliday junction resolvase RusA-like endonuclease
MTPVRLTLPWDVLCSVNQRTNPIRGRQFLTKKYRVALRTAEVLVIGQVRGRRPVFPSEHLAVEMRFCTPDKRRRDVGNYTKLVEDAMTGTVYTDDSQIKDSRAIEVGLDRRRPRVEVIIRALEEA